MDVTKYIGEPKLTVAYNVLLNRVDAVYGYLNKDGSVRIPEVTDDVTTPAALAVGKYMAWNHVWLKFKDDDRKMYVLKVEEYEDTAEEEEIESGKE